VKRFADFLGEETEALHVYDIDDTLVHPTAKINVKNAKGEVVKSLNTHEYAKSSRTALPKEHSYDFGEFRSAEKFSKESKPIKKMISHVRLTSASKSNKVIFNTARENLDEPKKFVGTFKQHGVDMKKIHVIRAGNVKAKLSGPQKKAHITSGYIKTHRPKEVHMYDDDKGNLDHFLALKQKHPKVNFYAHHVQPDGSMKPYNGKNV
jgi:hypothetical protein